MTISPTQLALYRSLTNDDSNNNGGRSTLTPIASGVRNGLFSDIQSGASLAGDTELRKVFLKQNLNAIDSSVYDDLYVYLKEIGDSDVFIDIAYGTATDTQNGVTFGSIICGRISAVQGETATLATQTAPGTPREVSIVRYRSSNNTVSVIDGVTVTQSSALEATLSGLTVGDVIVGDIITERVYFESGVSGEERSLTPRVENPTVTSASGTFNGDNVRFSPRAAASGQVSISFTSAQAYTVSIPALGITNTVGSRSGELQVNHPDATSPSADNAVLILPTSVFGGTYAAGDTITFDLVSGTVPIWIRRLIGQNPTISGQQDVNFSLDYMTD